MSGKRKKRGKGSRSISRIGCRRKNTLWKRKKTCTNTLNLDSDSSGFPEPAASSDDTELEELSPEVPSDLEDIVLEIVAELDNSPAAIPSTLVSSNGVLGQLCKNWG